MGLQPDQLLALKVELTTDPDSIGYSGSAGDKSIQANKPRANVIQAGTLTRTELQESLIGSEYVLLNPEKRALWSLIVSSSEEGRGVSIGNSNIRAQIAEVWPSGSITKNNIVAKQSKPDGSQIEKLFGWGSYCDNRDITNAMELE